MQIERKLYKPTATALGLLGITATGLSIYFDVEDSGIYALVIIFIHNLMCFTLPNTFVPKSYRQALALSGTLSVLLSYALLLMTYKFL